MNDKYLSITHCLFLQTLRDEMIHLEQRHCQDLFRQKSEHEQKMERTIAEQLSMREELRKELTQMHMEKLGAMAAELSHVHKVRTWSRVVMSPVSTKW